MLESLLPSPAPQLAMLALTSSLSPGANSLLISATAAQFGVRRSLRTLSGMYAGFGLMFVAVGFGASAVFETWPWLLVLLQWAGAAYMLHLAWGLLRARWAAASTAAAPIGFARAALLQFLYPKLWLMAVATIAMCTGDDPAAGVSLPLVLFFVAMTLPGMLLYLRLGGVLRSIAKSPRLRTATNLALAGLTALSALMLLVSA